MTEALEGRRPASLDDIRELQKELRAIVRRLDAIEQRLPAKRKTSAQRKAPTKGTTKRSS
jgi:hypothetical protein